MHFSSLSKSTYISFKEKTSRFKVKLKNIFFVCVNNSVFLIKAYCCVLITKACLNVNSRTLINAPLQVSFPPQFVTRKLTRRAKVNEGFMLLVIQYRSFFVERCKTCDVTTDPDIEMGTDITNT